MTASAQAPSSPPAQPPSPERILQSSLAGHAVAATMAAACRFRLFTHMDAGAATVEQIATQAGISRRGAQALLDALAALGFVQVRDGRYANAEEASFYLVEGKPAYLGAFAQLTHSPFGDAFRELAEVARDGAPRFQYTADTADNKFWEDLVLAIVPLAVPVVQVLLQSELAHKQGLSLLDVGGGAGIYSAMVLQHNATARAMQIDWPNVNRIGRSFVERFGVGDRFTTIDSDFHTSDFGESAHDLVVLSNICHQESPRENVNLFRKARRALRPGGRLVLSEFVLEDDRTAAQPWCGIFQVFMLIQSREGAAWRKADYRGWLADAGFTSVEFQTTPTPSTLVWARISGRARAGGRCAVPTSNMGTWAPLRQRNLRPSSLPSFLLPVVQRAGPRRPARSLLLFIKRNQRPLPLCVLCVLCVSRPLCQQYPPPSWHFGQKCVDRPPRTIRSIGVPQRGQGLPLRS